jgi:ribonuclease E
VPDEKKAVVALKTPPVVAAKPAPKAAVVAKPAPKAAVVAKPAPAVEKAPVVAAPAARTLPFPTTKGTVVAKTLPAKAAPVAEKTLPFKPRGTKGTVVAKGAVKGATKAPAKPAKPMTIDELRKAIEAGHERIRKATEAAEGLTDVNARLRAEAVLRTITLETYEVTQQLAIKQREVS